MADLKISVDRALATANELKKINKDINSDFDTMTKAIKKLDEYWDSPAAKTAIQKYDDIYNACFSARYEVVDLHIKFLMKYVSDGYTKTEDANVIISEKFK